MVEAGGLTATVVLVLLTAFNRPGQLNPFLAMLVFPVLIIAALRLRSGAHLIVTVTAILALWFSAHGQGPLVQADLHALGQAVQVFSFLAMASLYLQRHRQPRDPEGWGALPGQAVHPGSAGAKGPGHTGRPRPPFGPGLTPGARVQANRGSISFGC